jgi:hypothetical protein
MLHYLQIGCHFNVIQSRKTLSYQKRQKMVNFCCVSACPFMMVAMSGILGIVLTNLITSGNDVQGKVTSHSALCFTVVVLTEFICGANWIM